MVDALAVVMDIESITGCVPAGVCHYLVALNFNGMRPMYGGHLDALLMRNKQPPAQPTHEHQARPNQAILVYLPTSCSLRIRVLNLDGLHWWGSLLPSWS